MQSQNCKMFISLNVSILRTKVKTVTFRNKLTEWLTGHYATYYTAAFQINLQNYVRLIMM